MKIPAKAIEVAARAIYGIRAREWSTMERMTCESQARRALSAAAPYMQAGSDAHAYVPCPNPCLERHSHPDPAHMCMLPKGHK